MKKKWIPVMAGVLLAGVLGLAGCGSDSSAAGSSSNTVEAGSVKMKENPKILVTYYSQKNHTREAAENIARLTGADIFEIQPETPYPEDHDPCLARQMDDLNHENRPAVAGHVDNMADYDVVFVGYPIWYYVEPLVVDTFLQSYDLSGKTVVPFCTSGGYPIDDSLARIQAAAPGATVVKGMRIGSASDAETLVSQLGLGK